jgi:CBS domain-containing protein
VEPFITFKQGGGAVSQVRDVMTASPTACRRSTPIREVARMMAEQDVGALPVAEGDELVGMITDRDLVVRVLAEDRDPATTEVGEIASRKDLVTVEQSQDLDVALQLMARHQVRRLPVVDHGRLVGIVAQADVARTQPPEETGSVVEDISR